MSLTKKTSEFTIVEDPPTPTPPPEVTTTEIHPKQAPGGARALYNAARKAGFNARITYARGYVRHATQDSFILKHSIVVRIDDRETGQTVAGATYYAKVSRPEAPAARYAHADTLRRILDAHFEPKYTLGSCLVRSFMGSYRGIFSSRELKAWLLYQPEPRSVDDRPEFYNPKETL